MGIPENAASLGAEVLRKPADRIVITGYKQLTPLGDTDSTWEGILDGRSGVRLLDIPNFQTRIGAPFDFNPEDHFTRREMAKIVRRVAPLNAVSIHLARQAAAQSGILGEEGKLRSDLNRRRAGVWIGTGIGAADNLIDTYKQLYESTDDEGRPMDPLTASEKVNMWASIQFLIEEITTQTAMDLGLSGWSGLTVEACATGLSNPVEAVRTIRDGYNDLALAGGVEDPFNHSDVAIASFATLPTVLSARNDDPQTASRPFNVGRDGFVMGAGGAIMVFESLDHAKLRNAPIFAEVMGFSKSVDGGDSITAMSTSNVARTIAEGIYNWKDEKYHRPDVIFAHATSTELGDVSEMDAMRMVFDDLPTIPIAAIKSNMGHLLGGAGAVNAVAAIQALNSGRIPPIRNLQEVDPVLTDLDFVRGAPREGDFQTALVVAYGFGGFDASMLLKRYEE